MRLSIDTRQYNDRRYSTPWIARVTFDSAGSADMHWGNWIGDAGDAGTLYLDCQPGDVVAMGQRDMRNPRKSALSYYIVTEDGDLPRDEDGDINSKQAIAKADAYKHWLLRQDSTATNPLADVSTDALLAELQRRGAIIK